MTSLSEKPDDSEVTISLNEDIKRSMMEPGVEGLYKTDGSYRQGRPILRHEEGLFTLSLYGRYWRVRSSVGGHEYLYSGSVPSQYPDDPRAARNERLGLTHWRYRNKQDGVPESSGISLRCENHQPTVRPQEIESPPSAAIEQWALVIVSDPFFLLISSRGPSDDHQGRKFGLYRKTEEMREGRSVYMQMHDTNAGRPGKLSYAKGVWRITDGTTVYLRTATPSESP